MNSIKQENDILKIKTDKLYINIEAYGNGIRFYATASEIIEWFIH